MDPGDNWLEDSFVENRGLAHKLNVNTILGCITKSVASKARQAFSSSSAQRSWDPSGVLCPALSSPLQEGH